MSMKDSCRAVSLLLIEKIAHFGELLSERRIAGGYVSGERLQHTHELLPIFLIASKADKFDAAFVKVIASHTPHKFQFVAEETLKHVVFRFSRVLHRWA